MGNEGSECVGGKGGFGECDGGKEGRMWFR